MTNPLTTHTQTPQTLSEAQIAQLYTLYQTYYGGTTPELFCRDLQEKDQILILQDNQTPVGFTTLKIIRAGAAKPCRSHGANWLAKSKPSSPASRFTGC